MAKFSEKLKSLRAERMYTQAQVAKVLGISTRVYQQYEAGTVNPGTDKLLKLADMFNVTTDYLLFGDKHPIVEAVISGTFENRLLIAASKLTDEQRERLLRLIESM